MTVHPAKTQISLDITVCVKKACILSYPLSAQRRLWSDWADARLIWVFVGCTLILLVLSYRGSIFIFIVSLFDKCIITVITKLQDILVKTKCWLIISFPLNILSVRTDMPGLTVQTQISNLIRVYTVCHSVFIVWTHYSMVEPHSSNFRVISTNFWGVQIFRKLMVMILQTSWLFICHYYEY